MSGSKSVSPMGEGQVWVPSEESSRLVSERESVGNKVPDVFLRGSTCLSRDGKS